MNTPTESVFVYKGVEYTAKPPPPKVRVNGYPSGVVEMTCCGCAFFDELRDTACKKSWEVIDCTERDIIWIKKEKNAT